MLLGQRQRHRASRREQDVVVMDGRQRREHHTFHRELGVEEREVPHRFPRQRPGLPLRLSTALPGLLPLAQPVGVHAHALPQQPVPCDGEVHRTDRVQALQHQAALMRPLARHVGARHVGAAAALREKRGGRAALRERVPGAVDSVQALPCLEDAAGRRHFLPGGWDGWQGQSRNLTQPRPRLRPRAAICALPCQGSRRHCRSVPGAGSRGPDWRP